MYFMTWKTFLLTFSSPLLPKTGYCMSSHTIWKPLKGWWDDRVSIIQWWVYVRNFKFPILQNFMKVWTKQYYNRAMHINPKSEYSNTSMWKLFLPFRITNNADKVQSYFVVWNSDGPIKEKLKSNGKARNGGWRFDYKEQRKRNGDCSNLVLFLPSHVRVLCWLIATLSSSHFSNR